MPAAHETPPANALTKPLKTRIIARMTSGLLTILALYVVWLLMLYFMQDAMLFPRGYVTAPAVSQPVWPTTEVFEVEQPDGQATEAWFTPAAPPEDEVGESRWAAPLVVYCHGNAELIDFQDDVIAAYAQMGVAVLLVEYRGYGRSGGLPSQTVIREDTLKALERVTARADVDAERVFYHGRSVGAAVAADLASVRPPAG